MSDGKVTGWAAQYDALAGDYDAVTAASGWAPNRELAGVLETLPLTPRTVLDLGAGTGQTSSALEQLYPEARLTMVEPSTRMAALAARRLPRATLVVRDAETFLASDHATYDLVVAVGLLELVADLGALLRAATRRLAPGGHLAVTHEPLLPASPVQGEAVSVHSASGGVTVRRHPRAEVHALAAACGLTPVVARDVVAYRRGDTLEDVVYELLVWRQASVRAA